MLNRFRLWQFYHPCLCKNQIPVGKEEKGEKRYRKRGEEGRGGGGKWMCERERERCESAYWRGMW